MFRKYLDLLYALSGAIGALFLVMIGLLMLSQMLARAFGFQIRGVDDLTAWSVAATAMLSLAYAFRKGAHIRVTILIGGRSANVRRIYELVCLLVSAVMALILAYASLKLTYDSWQYKEIAMGSLRVPLWIPQTSMCVGAFIFFIAIIDDFFAVMCGKDPSYIGNNDGI